MPEPSPSHAVDACLAALEIQDFMARANAERGKIGLSPWEIRIGLHTGPVMAGVVGRRKFTYDIWGDAVNVAAAMEANGVAGRIVLSDRTRHQADALFETSPHGTVEVKNRGPMETWFLDRIRADFAEDTEGRVSNAAFAARRGDARG